MKKVQIIISLLVLSVFLVACSAQNPGQADAKLTKEQAKKIAETAKECVDAGGLKKSDGWYNPNSKTWWFSIDNNKEGCNPACVVSEDGTAEVNWMCTGLKK